MTAVLVLFIVQGALGALDTLWHHEFTEKLPARPGAREELALHAAREAIYAVIFLILPWVRWEGALALALAGLLAVEAWITLRDFVVEDRTRRLPPSERVLHTVMAIGFGAILAALAPVLAAWVQAPTGFVVEGHGPLSWAMTLLGLGVLAWAVRDGLAVLHAPRPVDPPTPVTEGPAVLITGATGFIGTALVERLATQGRRVIVVSRDPMAARTRFPAPAVLVFASMADIPAETAIEAMVNLAGASVAGGPWTKGRRRVLMESRLRTTRAVLALAARLTAPPRVLVNASAVGFYGDRDDEPLAEDAPAGAGFMAELCAAWEAEAFKAKALGMRVCALRLGLVFHWAGGILPMLALPARFGLGAVMGSGRQWAPWVHRDDVVRMIEQAIADGRWEGPVNAVAPQLVTQGGFMVALAKALRRPVWLKVPAFTLRLGMGELSDLMLAGQRAEPRRLAELGFTFTRPDLASALAPKGAYFPAAFRASISSGTAAL